MLLLTNFSEVEAIAQKKSTESISYSAPQAECGSPGGSPYHLRARDISSGRAKLLLSRRNFGIWVIQSDLLEGDASPSQYWSEFGFYE
jgi:hypothetical protein